MPRVDELLELVEDPSARGLVPGEPGDDALLALLAHVAFSDGVIDDRELAFLAKVLPDRDPAELREWVLKQGSAELDFEAVAEALPSAEERWTCLRFATRMAFKDGHLADEEQDLLSRLVDALDLPRSALGRVLREMHGRAQGAIPMEKLERVLHSHQWAAVQHGKGEMRSELADLVPPEATVVGRIGLDNVEVLGLLDKGVVGRFLEGEAFVPWDELVTYSRVPTVGAAIQLHTETGRRWTLVDHRLNGLGALFDKLYAPDDPPPRRVPPPKIERVRGDE